MKKVFLVLGVFFLLAAVASSIYFYSEYKKAKNKTIASPGTPPVQQEEKRIHLKGDTLDNPTGPVIPSEFNYEEEMKKYNEANSLYQAELSTKEDKESFNQTAMFASGGVLAVLALICFGFAALLSNKEEGSRDSI